MLKRDVKLQLTNPLTSSRPLSSTWISDLSFQALVVITLHLSGFMNNHTLLASSCRTDAFSCIVDQESSMSAISSAKSNSHKCTSPVHVISPALLSVFLLSIQSIVIANSSGDRMQPCRTPVITCLEPAAHVPVDFDRTVALLINLLNNGNDFLWYSI